MNYCTECGKPLGKDHDFCTHCGTKYESPDQQLNNKSSKAGHSPSEDYSYLHPPPEQRKQKRYAAKQNTTEIKRQPMKKRTKIIIAAAVSLIVTLFGTHLGLSSYFDPMRDLQAMDQAVASNNATEFASYIDFNEEASLNKEAYLQYIKGSEWETVKTQYTDITRAESPLTSTIRSTDGSPLFTVLPENHVFGLYTTYSLSAEPSILTVHTPIDDTAFSIGDVTDTISTDTPKEISLYPGTYKITGTASNMFGDFTFEDSIDIPTQQADEINLEFTGETYAISTNQQDAVLFVDGASTERTLGEIDSLGPIPEDSNSFMHAEWTAPSGNVIQSETVTQNDASLFGTIEFDFEEQEETAQPKGSEQQDNEETQVASAKISSAEAGDTVLQFRDAYERAVNAKDYRLIDSYLLSGSDAAKELQTYIGDLQETAFQFDFTSNEVLHVEQIDDETAKVTTNELFTFTNHLGEVTDYDRVKTYTMKLVNGDYKISLIEYDQTNRDHQS